MKYVAFIGTLGFKQQFLGISHEDAKSLTQKFNQEIDRLWPELGYRNDVTISELLSNLVFVVA